MSAIGGMASGPAAFRLLKDIRAEDTSRRVIVWVGIVGGGGGAVGGGCRFESGK